MRKVRGSTGIAIVAIALSLTQGSIASADPAFCIERVSSYVAELDHLLSTERNWITPFYDLNKKYLPFQGCEVDALLREVSRSRFIERIRYNSPTKQYSIIFSSKDVQIGFAYLVSEKRSEGRYLGWVNK